MKIKIISRETIKPAFPTPNSYNLCLMDQLSSPPVYSKLYLFYQNFSIDNLEDIIMKRSRWLKSSLSETLIHFYPLAGRIRDQMTVSLEKDDGAEFLKAQVDSDLLDYLENPIPEMFLHLVPEDCWDLGRRPILVVQASFFKCGGLSIGLNIAHKVSDACSFTLFLNAWASKATGERNCEKPDFCGSLAFPAVDELFISGEHFNEIVKVNDKTKRFVFTAQKIAALQEKATTKPIQKVTRVEAVTAFIWRIGMKMSIKMAGGSPVPSTLVMPVNLRKWSQPPISSQTFGNLVEYQIMQNDSCNIELPYLLSLIRERTKESREAYTNKLDGNQFLERCVGICEKLLEVIPQPDIKNAFTISSWSRFPLYNADFGWGKPTWVTYHNSFPYVTYLMDTRDGTGIEAWVNFSEEDMSIFESDEELLTYAIPNPSIL